VFMMTAVAIIAGTVVLEARPVYAYLRAKMYGTPLDATEMVIGFGLAAVLCLAATFIPLRVARIRLEAVER